MSLIGLFDALLVQPLMAIYELVFREVVVHVPNLGWALIVFSVLLNFALMPIYFQMERAGRESARKRARADEEVERVKSHFKGRELYFYIRTIHRHYGYRPISVVFSSSDLYLQILVFATVYHYISGLESIVGATFFAIPDLSHPDGLLFGQNLLPILMTLANILSAIIYGDAKSKRRQAFGLAALFFVLLYRSPSGLLLYWTSNNVFSLLRNLIQRKVVPNLPPGLARGLTLVSTQK